MLEDKEKIKSACFAYQRNWPFWTSTPGKAVKFNRTKCFVPETETVEQVEEKVRGYIENMGLPEAAKEVDKALGAKKDINAKWQETSERYC